MRAAVRMFYMERKFGVFVRVDLKDEKRIYKWKKKIFSEEKMLGLSRYQEEDLGFVKVVDFLRQVFIMNCFFIVKNIVYIVF